MLTTKEIDAIAAAIADDLFTSGQGKQASRLVLENPLYPTSGRDFGGWGKVPAADRIAKSLSAPLRAATDRLAFLESLADAAAVWEGTRETGDLAALQALIHRWNSMNQESED